MNNPGAVRQARSSGRAATPIIIAISVWLLAGPRVELLQVAGSSLRLEDFILVFLWCHVARSWGKIRNHKLLSRGIGAVIAVSLFAGALGASTSRVELLPSLLYALRPLEYWVLYPAIALILFEDQGRARGWIVRALTLITLLQAGTAALQYLGGINLGFSRFSYERGAGLSAGPYELGAISAMLACYWFASRRYGLFAISVAALLMSQSRVSLLGLGLAGLVFIATRRQSDRANSGSTSKAKSGKLPSSLLVVGSTLLAIGAILATPLVLASVIVPALTRLDQTSPMASWQEANFVVDRTPLQPTSKEYGKAAYDEIGSSILQVTTSSDASNVVRFYRWQLLLREVTKSPQEILFGLGPSFAGPSVDGAFLRVWIESGLIGVIAWGVVCSRWVHSKQAWFTAVVSTFLVGSIFIDLPFAMRPMLLLWMLFAVAERDTVVNVKNSEINPTRFDSKRERVQHE
jgi:hypothetical protein